MLRKFICEIVHYYSDDQRVTREHIVYMPQSEYDTSGSRWRNERWVENKLKDKLGDQWEPGRGSKYYVRRIYQERL